MNFNQSFCSKYYTFLQFQQKIINSIRLVCMYKFSRHSRMERELRGEKKLDLPEDFISTIQSSLKLQWLIRAFKFQHASEK